MNRPTTSLPGLGDRRPGASQLPVGDRRDQLRDRLSGDTGIADRERPNQLPARDWDQVRQDWTERRDDIRNNWQDNRDDWQDRWQDWHDEHCPWYGGWYWGFAPAYWGWWDPLWDNYPAAATMGTTWWDANSLGYAFGYDDYYNPYYAEGSAVDYSEPMMTVAAPDESAPEPPQDALGQFDQARIAFYEGNYEEALTLIDAAAKELPRDAVLHEFRSLVLFALGRYEESAAAIHAVLDVGPGWDWKTLSSLYPDVETYTKQLRALEAYRNKNPKAAYAHFLLGYHRLSCGFPESALSQFRRASQLQPDDAVSANLVRALTPREPSAGPASSEHLAKDAPKPVPPDALVGTWTATGEGNSQYAMKLDKEGNFTWSFVRGTRKESVKGVFTSEGNVLAMEPDTGGVMLAELTPRGADQIQFKMVGGTADDPGLTFRRTKTG